MRGPQPSAIELSEEERPAAPAIAHEGHGAGGHH